MKFPLVFLLGASLLTACGEKQAQQATDNTAVNQTSSSAATCYSRLDNQDLTVVQLTQDRDKVSGYYAWEPYEKDGAHGSFEGINKDGMITADHTYMIEGSIQTDEVYFKLDGDKLLEGVGEMMDENGKMVAKSIDALQFTEALDKTDCGKVQEAISNTEQMVAAIAEQQANGDDPMEQGSPLMDNLIGEWESVDDPKSHVQITGDTYTDVYDGKEMEAGAYTILDSCPTSCGENMEDMTCLQVSGQDERCFAILQADGEILSLSYTKGTGQPNNYKRVEQ